MNEAAGFRVGRTWPLYKSSETGFLNPILLNPRVEKTSISCALSAKPAKLLRFKSVARDQELGLKGKGALELF